MDKIDVGAPRAGERRDRFFARAVGTKFEAKAESSGTVIHLYDEIGYWGVNARSFRSQLSQVSGDITLRINSPGGDVFDGISIYNDLLAYDGKVKVEVVGLAASIASIIAMAGDEIVIADNAMFMIHNAWTIGVGNRHDLSDVATVLGKIDDALARTYAARTTTGIRAIKQMMDDETWLTAREAKDAGFATSIGLTAEPQAKFDLSVFGHVPKALLWEDDDTSDTQPTKRDMERALTQDAGWSRSKARAAMREVDTSDIQATRDAGDVKLSGLAEALAKARAAFHTQS
ncbi:ATP-dependent protease ClpP, protease subunit [Rhizobium sp. NFR07]|uniref:head maturation protease, ClpP-related n=1 Tax=Rhizobium sp. NFR07 TaxID=1566262 RepID=UPI0008EB6B5A|nr:head maturation protease, ClpP-related [Rhizobium sp. NFR07]SFB52366.1 ATP-dependent protease ClpP, protease subunit [Rhizobium sp. NFR07]